MATANPQVNSQHGLVPDQSALLGVYQPNIRQRFKAEINRLTSGGMAELLAGRGDTAELSFPLTYLYAWHWLQHNVPASYREGVLSAFRGGARAFLMDLLLNAQSGEDFIDGYISHWQQSPANGPIQQQQLNQLLAANGGNTTQLKAYMLGVWEDLGQFQKDYKEAYTELAHHERDRYRDMLSEDDRKRLQQVDALPDSGQTKRFAKLGIIPAMGCPQTCRHCMFIFRPLMGETPDAKPLYELVDGLTDSVLFTGGDLTKHLDHFYRAIREMRHIHTFAILLNGDFADTPEITEKVMKKMADSIKARPGYFTKAKVLLQISFDEFHQEVVVDKKGQLKERIPITKIANIVETAPRYHKQLQLCLLHKQHQLNFSMDLFNKGVFARLVNELGSRGHQVQILSTGASSRLKTNPLGKGEAAPLIKDASFALSKYPERPMLLTSSTIDAYGRAEMIEAGESVKEKELLAQVLRGQVPDGESFDNDLMFWFNGWVTLFNAVHISLGNLYEEGADTILQRHHKDPLSLALKRFDLKLLEFYAEVRDDLQSLIDKATGPHHLFHMLTEESSVRLHMTERLIATA